MIVLRSALIIAIAGIAVAGACRCTKKSVSAGDVRFIPARPGQANLPRSPIAPASRRLSSRGRCYFLHL
jgi:hypothetical protein